MAGFSKFQIAKLDLLVGPIRIVIQANRFDFFSIYREGRSRPSWREWFLYSCCMLPRLDLPRMSGSAFILCYAAKGLDLPRMPGSAFILCYGAKGLDLLHMLGSAFIVCSAAKELDLFAMSE